MENVNENTEEIVQAKDGKPSDIDHLVLDVAAKDNIASDVDITQNNINPNKDKVYHDSRGKFCKGNPGGGRPRRNHIINSREGAEQEKSGLLVLLQGLEKVVSRNPEKFAKTLLEKSPVSFSQLFMCLAKQAETQGGFGSNNKTFIIQTNTPSQLDNDTISRAEDSGRAEPVVEKEGANAHVPANPIDDGSPAPAPLPVPFNSYDYIEQDEEDDLDDPSQWNSWDGNSTLSEQAAAF